MSAYFWPPSLAQTRHVAPLVSSLLLVMYVLYIYLCKMTFDVFDCQPSPTTAVATDPLRGTSLAPDMDANGDWIQYLQADKTPCRYVQPGAAQVGGYTQSTLLPGAVASIIIYVVGYPFVLGAWVASFRARRWWRRRVHEILYTLRSALPRPRALARHPAWLQATSCTRSASSSSRTSCCAPRARATTA